MSKMSQYLPPVCDKIDDLLRSAAVIAVTTHIRMDGDAVGSTIAMSEVLKAMGKDVRLFNPSPPPANTLFLSNGCRFHSDPQMLEGVELIISLDCANIERIGLPRGIELGVPRINIDHHISNSLNFEFDWVDDDAPCVGEMLLNFFTEYRYNIPDKAMDAMYLSLVTDTGRFSFANTTSRAFSAAFRLTEGGVDPGKISARVYFSMPTSKIKLLQLAYSRLQFCCDDRIAFIAMNSREIEALGLTIFDTQEIVDIPRAAGRAEVAIFFLGVGEDTRVSLRSKFSFDSCRLAKEFGGGGHKAAAGLVAHRPLDEVIRIILHRATEMIESHPRED